MYADHETIRQIIREDEAARRAGTEPPTFTDTDGETYEQPHATPREVTLTTEQMVDQIRGDG